jgi:hypothetical protein
MTKLLPIVLFSAALFGCSSQTVPQAHKGRMFDKTGFMAFYAGGRGFESTVLPPGTYYTGIYPEVRMLDCTRRTIKEPLSALAKDSVQFSLDIYISYSANCDDDEAVKKLLSDLAPIGHNNQEALVIDVGDDASDMSTKRAAVEAARSYVTGRGVFGSYGRMEQVDCALVYKSTYDDHIPVFIIWRTRDRDGEEVVHTASDREMSQNSLLALVRRVYPKACGFRSPV